MAKVDLAREGDILGNDAVPIAQRMRAVFLLKQESSPSAIDYLCRGISDPSVLLAHECCYVLGQLKDPYALPALRLALANPTLDPVVRHEAAEAIGAIGLSDDVDYLRKFVNDRHIEVAETCQIAIALIEDRQQQQTNRGGCGRFDSVDPALPAPVPAHAVDRPELQIAVWGADLSNEQLPLSVRYKAMFALRDNGSPSAVEALCAAFSDRSSALFRHEIAYVLGQLQDPISRDALVAVLKDKSEHEMVRHEAAEALGAIADQESLSVLNEFALDSDLIVKQSCEVALDLYHHWNQEST